jgi:hypothetical protein
MNPVVFRSGAGIVSISEAAVNAVLATMHAAQRISHHRVAALDGRFIDVTVGAPRIRESRCSHDERLEFRTTTRIRYAERDAGDRAGTPRQQTVDVDLTGFAETPKDHLYDEPVAISVPVGWTGAALSEPGVDADRLGPGLHALATGGSGRFTVPHRGTRAAAARVLPRWSAPAAPIPAPGGGDRPAWQILVPAKAVIRDIRRGMRATLGAVPPGPASAAGPATVIGGLDDAPYDLIAMTRMEIRLSDGHVEYDINVGTGDVRRRLPDRLHGRVAVDDSDSDRLTHGLASLQRRIDASIRATLLDTTSERVALAGLSTLAELLTGGAAADLFVPVSRRIDPAGLILEGAVEDRFTAQPVEVSFTLGPTNDPAEIWFHAGQSWAPGGTVARYEWDFGDGTVTATSDFMERHRYANPGDYTVSLTVHAEDGRQATASRAVAAGQVQVDCQWAGRDQSLLVVRVRSMGAPLEGVRVDVGNRSGVTSVDGIARLGHPRIDGELEVGVRCGEFSTIRAIRPR